MLGEVVKFRCYSCGDHIQGPGEACPRCILRGGGTSARSREVVMLSILWGVAIAAAIVFTLLLVMT
jgi:hypothetical protein